jgi:hypothetical protein
MRNYRRLIQYNRKVEQAAATTPTPGRRARFSDPNRSPANPALSAVAQMVTSSHTCFVIFVGVWFLSTGGSGCSASRLDWFSE